MRVLDELVDRRREWTIGQDEGAALIQSENRRTGMLAVGLVGLSLLLVGLAGPFELAVRAASLGVASLLAIWTVAQAGRP